MGRMLLVLLMLVAMGGHISVIQIAAWTGMIISRTPAQGFSQAVASTLSGDQPCRVCQTVKQLEAAQDAHADDGTPAQPHPDAPTLKMVKEKMATVFAGSEILALTVQVLRPVWPTCTARLPEFVATPPVPPPQTAVG